MEDFKHYQRAFEDMQQAFAEAAALYEMSPKNLVVLAATMTASLTGCAAAFRREGVTIETIIEESVEIYRSLAESYVADACKLPEERLETMMGHGVSKQVDAVFTAAKARRKNLGL